MRRYIHAVDDDQGELEQVELFIFLSSDGNSMCVKHDVVISIKYFRAVFWLDLPFGFWIFHILFYT